ncbi:MAG: ABC transporter [Chloroflexi bacterium]|nr:MAG: ABC transporter [Chloroflexota bacterium]MBL1196124.1 ABC transporter [Chloroflexota bacterium]NOH13417.1 ABC transporter permease [Chloroflexota bacterium]
MNATILLWQKQMKKALVHPEEIVGMLIQPILWVILFGVGMRSLMGTTTPNSGNDYMTFVVPGIVALTAVSAAIAGGSTWLNERLIGIVKEYLAAPIPRLSILMGNASSIVTKVLIQSVIILIVGLLMGATLSSNPLGWLGGLLLIAGYGIGFSGFALAVASSTDSSEGYHMMIFLLQLPLLFLSNSLYPLQTLPAWMRIGAYANPTTYVVTGLRQITLGAAPTMGPLANIPLWLCFLIAGVFAAFGMNLALRAFKAAIK